MNRWNRVRPCDDCGKIVRGAYVSALVAMGMAAAVWGQGQAIDPVNVSGQAGQTPSAATPRVGAPAAPGATAQPTEVTAPVAQRPAGASPGAANQGGASGAATQGITPVNVGGAAGNNHATPAAATPSAATPSAQTPPVTSPTPAAQAPVTPAPTPVAVPPQPVTPAAQSSTPTTPATASPTTPSTPVTPTPAEPVAPATAAATTTIAPPTTNATPEALASGQAIPADGKAYPVTGLKIDYKNTNSEQPPISALMNAEVRLGVTADGYVAPRGGVPIVTIKLGDIGKNAPQKIYRSGIAAIYTQIVRYYNSRGIIGVFVVVDSNDIDSNDNDIRPADRTTLQLIVVTSAVKQIRTVAIGENSTDADRVDNPRHDFIREHSPLQPTAGKDLLRKDVLDEYVLRLNRFPGRRVDVAISGTNDPGGVTLDYLVSENRPWYVYAQASNTGTKQTNPWRERFGFVDNQLTGHDDILSFDYMTAGFDRTEAYLASYELPLFNLERVRTKIYGSYNEYTASDVGLNDETFVGHSSTIGDELIANIYQNRELFIDAIGGLRGQEVIAHSLEAEGYAFLIQPYGGFRLERATDIATTTGSITFVNYVTSERRKSPGGAASVPSLEGLGRPEPAKNPWVMQFDFAQSAFLEPLLAPDQFAAGKSTLAHEVYFSTHGQYSFGDRLVPTAEDVAGGLYSVRGYPESITAGDSVIVATAEYRLHLPRIFPIQADPTKTPFLWDKSFRFAPQQTYGHPDWDLIFRSFFDAAEVVNAQRQSGERDGSLAGAGVGIELQYRQNLNIRVDWGVALKELDDPTNKLNDVKVGDNRFHITTTILY